MSRFKVKGSVSNIILMVVLLVVIIIMMSTIKKREHKFTKYISSLSQFEESAKAIDRTYYNKPFRFSISAPDSNWEFKYSSDIDSSVVINSSENKPQLIVNISHNEQNDTTAIVTVEIFQLIKLISPRNLASRNLAHVKNQYKTEDEQVSIVSDVIIASSGNVVNAFHVVELPLSTIHPYPILVTMFSIRNQLAYKIICKVKREKYELYRADFEEILKSFTYL